VWADYMVALNWIRYNNNEDGINDKNKWIATDNGKRWAEKIEQYANFATNQ
jgi:hypothetical protein